MYRLVPWLAWALIGCSPLDDVSVGSDGGVGDVTHPLAAPPPISGGTLEATDDGETLVLSDRDGRRVHVVDLVEPTDRRFAADAPGRVAIGATHAYVVQEEGGLLAIPLVADRGDDGARVLRTCEGPRGVAHHDGRVVVVCLGGELVEVALDGGRPTLIAQLDADLRDVARHAGAWWISRFRRAELWRVDDDGAVSRVEFPLPAVVGPAGPSAEARVGWRLRALPDDRLGFLYQLHSTAPLPTHESGYAVAPAGCAGPVQSALTVFDAAGEVEQGIAIAGAVLIVDFAGSGPVVALAAAGAEAGGHHKLLRDIDWALHWGACAQAERLEGTAGQIVGVAAAGDGFYLHDRAGGAITRLHANDIYDLGGPPPVSVGHDVFHRDAGQGVACASCHPLGADDGHVWHVEHEGLRRTLSLRGGLLDTFPLHWEGEFVDFAALMADVFTLRMGGADLDPATIDALATWIDGLARPSYTVVVDEPRRRAGEELFAQTCAGCHAGGAFTDNQTHRVGGGRFATPPLRELWLRETLFHDGCRDALAGAAAFFACAASAHGEDVSGGWALTPDQQHDLFEFVKTL